MNEPLEQMFSDSRIKEALPPFEPRDWSRKYNETSVEMESRPPRLEDRFNPDGNLAKSHPWEVVKFIEANTLKIYVYSGLVITPDAPVPFESPAPPGAAFGLIAPAMVVYLKFTYADGTGELLATDVDVAAVIPVDTATEVYWTIADLVVGTNSRGDSYITSLNQRMFEDVRLAAADADEGPDHPWKVTRAANDGANPQISVVGGIMNTQETFADTVVAGVTRVAVSGEVTLKITRDSATRALTATDIIMVATADVPTTVNDYTYQYVALATVTVVDGIVTDIVQRKFEDIGIFEDMAVVQGEFQLVPLAMHGRTYYAPPI